MKILFFGTPLFSEIVFEMLQEKNKIVGVVCQEDKRANRGKKMQTPHIVTLAREKNIPVFQFEKLKEHIDDFKKIDCDIFVTASYGKMLPKELLDLKMCINVHPSLLPKYRGATPIQSAILNGDKITGVTIMRTAVGMDDGDIILQKEVEIGEKENYLSLMPRLAKVGGELLTEAIEKIESGEAVFQKQDDEKATYVKLIKKEDGFLDFNENAECLVNKVRAYVEFPVAFFFLGNERVKVYDAEEVDGYEDLSAGDIFVSKKEFIIKAKDKGFKILKCQVAGGKVLDIRDFLNGHKIEEKRVNDAPRF